MKVVLIEFTDEFHIFQCFLEKNNLRLDDFVIIALQPRLQAYLTNTGIQYQNTLPYFNNESHKKIIIESEKIMTYIRSHFDFVDRNDLKHCYETEFSSHIRLYLNHIQKMLEILENIYLNTLNVEIFASVSHFRAASLMISDSERYVGDLAERFAKKRGLQFTNINDNVTQDERDQTSKERLPRFENLFTKLFLFLLRKKRVIFVPVGGRLFKELLAQLFQKDKGMVFLAIAHSRGFWQSAIYNIHSFLRSIIDLKFCPYYLISTDCFYHANNDEQSELMRSIDAILGHQNAEIFKYNGIVYHDLIRDKANRALKSHMSKMVSQSHNLKYLFSYFRKRMIMSFSGLGVMGAAGELSRKMGMNSLFISHGAHPVPVDSYHEIELFNLCRGFMLGDYTHVALSTPVQEDHLHYFKNKYPWVNNTELRTGPLIFTNINGTHKASSKCKLGISPDDVVLTHAITQKYRNSERYYFIETLDESFSSMAELVRTVDKIDNVKLIFRIHPGFHMSNSEISALLPKSNRYMINRDGPFSEILAATDILISYSSTVIDEALINKVPVLFYDKWNRYNHFRVQAYDNPQSSVVLPACYLNDDSKLFETVCLMINEVRVTQKKDIRVNKYCYDKNYRDNFFKFVTGDWPQ